MLQCHPGWLTGAHSFRPLPSYAETNYGYYHSALKLKSEQVN